MFLVSFAVFASNQSLSLAGAALVAERLVTLQREGDFQQLVSSPTSAPPSTKNGAAPEYAEQSAQSARAACGRFAAPPRRTATRTVVGAVLSRSRTRTRRSRTGRVERTEKQKPSAVADVSMNLHGAKKNAKV